MNILGLHFGHDGAACIIRDGRIASFVIRERQAAVKHAIGITTQEVDLALSEAGITEKDIDAVAITSTQGMECLTGLIEDFSFEYVRHKNDTVESSMENLIKSAGQDIQRFLKFQLKDLFNPADTRYQNTLQYGAYSAICPEKEQVAAGTVASTGCLDDFIVFDPWKKGMGLTEIGSSGFPGIDQARHITHGFHYPVSVQFRGLSLPGYFIQHHMAHAASVFYRSGFSDAAIISHDGFSNGAMYNGGMIYHGRGHRITPVMTHHLELGSMYDAVGLSLKLGTIGPAGKLMGLAPYGKPRFYDPRFAGNMYDTLRKLDNRPLAQVWGQWCYENATALGWDINRIGSAQHITDPINADMAASTQKLFEESMLRTAIAAYHVLRFSKLTSTNLCLTGGTALNCPSNSLISCDSPFEKIYIEPNCGDDGLATGAALYVYHHLYEKKLEAGNLEHNQSPYQGPRVTEAQMEHAIAACKDKLAIEKLGDDTPLRAARDVQENRIIAWFEGRSELGPRALGHRSIVSHPGHAGNWEKVNRIKKRERWRPFAPSVLEEHAQDWFQHLPLPSPYMLFTGQVRSTAVPAITHVDGSARIQTVNASNGGYYRLIKEFHRLSGIPLVMNTSFNGPKQPIIETPEQAVAFLFETEIDALYMNGCRLTRAS